MSERHNGGTLRDGGENLVWIFGSSRSGSTWLLRMLSQLQGVVPIDDPHLGHHLGVWRPIALAWATAEEPPELRTLTDFKRQKRDYLLSDRYRERWLPALRELVRVRFEAQADEDCVARDISEPVVVVKEPASQVAELLLELFPSSRVIFLLRDGRDVVDSWVDGYRDGTWAHQGGAYPVSDEGRLALIRWQAAVWLRRTELMQRSFAEIEPANRILIRYEDLREEPAAALEDICELFGIEQARSRLRAVANANVYERVPSGEKGEGREIRRAMPGGWRENMSPVEIDAMHEILAGKLVELSYLNEGEGIEPTSLAERGSKGPRAA